MAKIKKKNIANKAKQENAKKFSKYFLSAAALIAIVCILGIIILLFKINSEKSNLLDYAQKNEAPLAQKTDPDKEQLQNDWPILPQSPLTIEKKKPVLPVLPKVDYDPFSFNRSNPMHFSQVNSRMFTLVSQHPEKEISKGLFEMIDTYKLGLYFINFPNGDAARFQTIHKSKISSGNPVAGEWTPYLIMEGVTLSLLNSEDSVAMQMIILYHENTHFLQWQKGTPEQKAVARDMKVLNPNYRQSEKNCDYFFENEMEAYEKECSLVYKWGVENLPLFGFCKYAGDQKAFRQQLFLMLKPKIESVKGLPECGRTWAQKAGHPHPEAFE